MLQPLLDLLFAPHCGACDARGARGLCDPCAASLYPVDSACPRCALPIDGPVAVICGRCLRDPPVFQLACAPYRYGGALGRALRRLKYQGRPDIARDLAPLFAPAVPALASLADVAVPVPLHWRRLSQRGFNQAVELWRYACPGGPGAPLPVDRLSLRRVRATAPQSGLSRVERRANTAAAFAVVPGRAARVRGRRVLLFDDVMTTGATMNACARALMDAGAASVIAFAVARAAA